MKTIIIAMFALIPFLVNAQSIKADSAYKSGIEFKTQSKNTSAYILITKRYPPSFLVKDSLANTIMKVDTAGVIHIYGDTINSLKAILKSLQVKIKE